MASAEIINLEKQLDSEMETLQIWEKPFQSIWSCLLLTISSIEISGRADTASDFSSRLCYIYDKVAELAAKREPTSTPEALTLLTERDIKDDINFLTAYAHFCMLMPQVYRGTLVLSHHEAFTFELSFKDEETIKAEIIDRLYSTVSLQIGFNSPRERDLRKIIRNKINGNESRILEEEFNEIKETWQFLYEKSFHVEVLSDQVLFDNLKFTNDQYHKFSAALRSWGIYFSILSKEYLTASNVETDHVRKNALMNEFLSGAVSCIESQTLEWFQQLGKIDKGTFRNLLEFYIAIYEDYTGESYSQRAFCGDGFLPPICIFGQYQLFSPYALFHLTNFNNLIYSLNKTDPLTFNNQISSHLEPVLIRQVEYLFSHFPDLMFTKNVNYKGGEMDFMVLSEKEKICLTFQVKGTIAPDSSRTVRNVEGRVIEAGEQFDKFFRKASEKRLEIVNQAFKSTLETVRIIPIILVRSCAGSKRAWAVNENYPILNYVLLGDLLACKIDDGDTSISDFRTEIYKLQEELKKEANFIIRNESLKIGSKEIKFPNFEYDLPDPLKRITRILSRFPRFESSQLKEE